MQNSKMDRWDHNRVDAVAAGIAPDVIEEYIAWRQDKKRLADMPPALQECHAAIQATPHKESRREWKAESRAR